MTTKTRIAIVALTMALPFYPVTATASADPVDPACASQGFPGWPNYDKCEQDKHVVRPTTCTAHFWNSCKPCGPGGPPTSAAFSDPCDPTPPSEPPNPNAGN
jgi:hypothetical protein